MDLLPYSYGLSTWGSLRMGIPIGLIASVPDFPNWLLVYRSDHRLKCHRSTLCITHISIKSHLHALPDFEPSFTSSFTLFPHIIWEQLIPVLTHLRPHFDISTTSSNSSYVLKGSTHLLASSLSPACYSRLSCGYHTYQILLHRRFLQPSIILTIRHLISLLNIFCTLFTISCEALNQSTCPSFHSSIDYIIHIRYQ